MNRSYCIKNKLKSEILNTKKKYKPKCLSAITKNLNWQILTKNLVAFKRQIKLRMKYVNIMGVHQFLGERGHKKTIYVGNCLRGGLDNQQKAWQKIKRRVLLRGEGGTDISMHTMT